MDILIDLHQRRFTALGKRGCFFSNNFTSFHREVAHRLFQKGQVELHWLELDGTPAAAQYGFKSGSFIYDYQTGMDPELSHESPGTVLTLALIRRAIEQGYQTYDFLRGDEWYKSQWRAEPHATQELLVFPKSALARLRHVLWLGRLKAEQWIKRALKRDSFELIKV
jgi:CelD/BcsL family acetyltransferase involved in cellulose biosynthesis